MTRLRRLYIWKKHCLEKQAFPADVLSDVHLQNNAHIPVAMRLGDTPVLIPNTMVKT